MKNHYLNFVWIMLVLLSGMGCNQNSRKEEARAFLDQIEGSAADSTRISEEIIYDILQQIPSPVEMSTLIKDVGMEYDNSFLSNADDYVNFNTSYQEAINLGIYGSDLIYTNIYGQKIDGISYIKAINNLATNLNLNQFFNLRLLSDLAMNSNKLDSLMLVTVRNFNDINNYLQEHKRTHLSVLFLVGGWIEAVHINCALALNNPGNEKLIEKIGEQKMTLESISLLLEFYSSTEPNIAELKEDIDQLSEAFKEVEIIYTYKKPTYEVVDGVLSIIDNSTSSVKINEDSILKISAKVKEIKNKIQS